MENRHVTTIRPGDRRKVIYGAGDEYHYFAAGAETDGHYFLSEGVVPPGGGPPPHIQTREEEAADEEMANHPEQALDRLNAIGARYSVEFFDA